ncbi:MAG: NADH-quinone oxidoreductase subunit L [Deltaproteobacteria bacterium]|nr:NADH-quinone oxidoreductase subunit L [Deltaproteobacteria bacterium]
MEQVSYLFLIPMLPLVGAAWNGLFGARLHKRLGETAIHWPAIILPWVSFLLSLWAFISLARLDESAALYQKLWSWLPLGIVNADVAFRFDRLSAVMAMVVTFVGSLIHIYSTGYMKDDPSYWRFFSYLNLFMFAMLTLVLADNFLLMFVGWEGVGLCSYLLISFWYKERANAAAGMKAFIVNRVGDLGFGLGMYLLFWGVLKAAGDSSLNFHTLETIISRPGMADAIINTHYLGISLPTLAAVLLFVGATAKSAQIPLYVWLPDAMAGPTPVSALIHAATMVTAGVYMVARLHFLFALTPAAMTIVALVGGLTALFAATMGLFQYDIKKVLAYSTVSQLGYMFMAVGVGAWWVGIFHLMIHAFFKACLFLDSGSVILACHHEQDMRKMGGLGKQMPITGATYLVSSLAISGIPFFAGFFSKDEILWKAFDSGNTLLPGGGFIIWFLGAVAALFTAFYMFRSYYMTFSGEYRGHADKTGAELEEHNGHHGLPCEQPKNITVVLIILAFLAAFGGFVGLPHLWHMPNLFEHWLEPVFISTRHRLFSAGHGPALEWALMSLSVVIAITGWATARWLYKDAKNPIPARLLTEGSPLVKAIHRIVFNKYYVDEAYEATFIKGALKTSKVLSLFDNRIIDGIVNLAGAVGRLFGYINGAIDKYFVDGIVNLVASVILKGGSDFSHAQTGRINTYILGLLGGSMVFLVLVYLIS